MEDNYKETCDEVQMNGKKGSERVFLVEIQKDRENEKS